MVPITAPSQGRAEAAATPTSRDKQARGSKRLWYVVSRGSREVPRPAVAAVEAQCRDGALCRCPVLVWACWA
jgi:hypothetical protein